MNGDHTARVIKPASCVRTYFAYESKALSSSMNQKVAVIIIAATPPSGCWVKALKLKRFVSLCSCSPDSQLQIKFSLFQPAECNNRLQNFYTTFNGAPNRRRRRRVSSFVPLWFMQTHREAAEQNWMSFHSTHEPTCWFFEKAFFLLLSPLRVILL